MIKIELDMYQTLAVAVLVLMLGAYLKSKIYFLEKFCIPAPVIGGLLFAIFTCICYTTGVAEFSFDDILREVCMVFFFTSVGFQANLKVLRSGGKSLILFLFLVIALIVSQNLLAVGIAKLLGLSPLVGMCTGSIPMVGGHGTAGAFGPVLEDFNIKGATTICTAAATFGLIIGIDLPILIIKPAAGITAITTIRAFPNFCQNSKLNMFLNVSFIIHISL